MNTCNLTSVNFEQCTEYLCNLLGDYHRDGSSAYKPGLERMQKFDARLRKPSGKFRSIHVAGTNGKGSVASMIASVLQTQGYRVGLYTSPHLLSLCERIKINAAPIPEKAVVRFMTKYAKSLEGLHLSFFEAMTEMAFWYFAAQKVDFAVIETGLGGLLDSTNIICPMLSVITGIALDHCELLGGSLAEIAQQKSGIIKEQTPVVVGKWQEETAAVFEKAAAEKNAPLFFADKCYKIMNTQVSEYYQVAMMDKGEKRPCFFHTDLMGKWQFDNLCTALTAIDRLRKAGVGLSENNMVRGLRHARKTTGLLGRWQILQTKPMTVCDIAHNADGLAATMAEVLRRKYGKLHIVLGISADKDLQAIIPCLPPNAYYCFTAANSRRALPADTLAKQCRERGLQGEVVDGVKNALARAQQMAQADDFIYVGGSAYVVADALQKN